MKKILVLFAAMFTLFSCSKDDDSLDNNLRLSVKSCVLDNGNSSVEVKMFKGTCPFEVVSSDTDVATVFFEDGKDDVFYIVGHGKGKAIITVTSYTETGENFIKTIDVDVCESISYPDYSSEVVYIKKGESRMFNLPFCFDKNDSLAVDNHYIASVFANAEMGQKYKIDAKSKGSTQFHIYKGKTELATVLVTVVYEYDLYIPPSEYRQLTFKLPFTCGVNGISIWRGSGQYTAKIEDETVAKIESITPGEDWCNEKINSAVVRATPLKVGTTMLIVTDMITGQTAGVKVEVD